MRWRMCVDVRRQTCTAVDVRIWTCAYGRALTHSEDMRADVCRQVRLVHMRWRMGADYHRCMWTCVCVCALTHRCVRWRIDAASESDMHRHSVQAYVGVRMRTLRTLTTLTHTRGA